MIIAYFPGAGGNRYLQRILGNSWTKLNISYDAENRGQLLEHRYLLGAIPQTRLPHTLTHCVNSTKIQNVFAGQDITFIKSDLKSSLRREWMLHGHDRFIKKQIKKDTSRLTHYQAIRDPSWPCVDSLDQLDLLPSHILSEVIADYEKIIKPTVPVPGALESLTQQCLDKINSAYEIVVWHKQYYNDYPQDFSCAHTIIDLQNDQDDFSVLMQQELGLYHSEIFDLVWDTVYNEQR